MFCTKYHSELAIGKNSLQHRGVLVMIYVFITIVAKHAPIFLSKREVGAFYLLRKGE